MPRITLIKPRQDTAVNWTSVDPVLAAGEEGIESDTGLRKLGDGATAWTALAYAVPVPPGTYAGAQTPGTAMVAEERAFNKVAAVPTSTDDTSGLVGLLADNPNVVLRSGTYKVDPNVLTGADRGHITGAGLNKTIIERRGAAPGWILKPGRYDSRLDGLTIDGLGVAGTTGIRCDETNPQNQASWGTTHVRNCPVANYYFYAVDDSGSAAHIYNNFGRMITDGGGIAVWFKTETGYNPNTNSNRIDYLRANSCETALQLDGSEELTIGALVAELCSVVAVRAARGRDLLILGGSFEGNAKDWDIADYPTFAGIVNLAGTDKAFPDVADYVESSSRSDLMSFTAGGPFKALAGRWFFDTLEARAGSAGTMKAKAFVPDAAGTRSCGTADLPFADVRTGSVHATGDAWSSRIITDAVSGTGQAGWRFGNKVAAAVALDAANYVEVEIGGVLIKLAVVT